jgi:outer membrane protein insertion porin family
MRPQIFLHKFLALALATGLAIAVNAQESGTIKEIVVRGNKRVSTQAIKSVIRVREGQLLNLNALDEDRTNVADMGWFSKVSYQKSQLGDNSWQVTFDVSEFDIVREVAILGNTGIKSEDILKVVTFLPEAGTKTENLKPFNQREIKATADAIQRLYADKGMLALVRDISPAQSSPTTVYINIQETVVNSVTIEGLTNTKKRVFDRLIKTKPGQIYNRRVWEKDYFRIVSTQWFEGVTPTLPTLKDEENGLLDLKVKLNDGRTGIFNAGIAIDPQNSIAGQFSYADTNFLGTGQNLAFNYIQPTVGVGGTISFDYTNPFFDRKDTTLRASIYDRVQFRFANNFSGGTGGGITNNQYSERRTGASLAASRPINETRSLGLTGRFERINVPNITPVAGQNFIQQDGEVGVLSLTSVLNTRDIDFDPARGRFLRLDLEPGYSIIRPADASVSPEGRFGFLRAGFDYRTYYTKDKKFRTAQDQSREVFAFRLRGGSIQGTVPFFEQYFAGGNDSIRGYQEDRFWGKNLLVASFEWRRPVQNQFSLVTFIDYGSAWGGYSSINDFTQTDKLQFRLGYGVGIRLRTPIGPVRLDFAFNGEGGSRPHFAIGTSF